MKKKNSYKSFILKMSAGAIIGMVLGGTGMYCLRLEGDWNDHAAYQWDRTTDPSWNGCGTCIVCDSGRMDLSLFEKELQCSVES